MATISKPNFAELAEAQRWDAEAFTPFLRSLDTKLANAPKLTALATVTHPAEIPRVYSEAGDAVPFLRAHNIRPFLPDTENLALIPATVAEDLPTNRLETGDVLVTRSGAFSGVAAVFLGQSGSSYASGEGIIVRSLGKIEGAYLVVFLNTQAGSALCRRAIYGSGQPHIGPKYLERVRVPRLGRIEKQVSELVHEAHRELQAAQDAYPQAEAELLDRLGWQDLAKEPRELTYSVSFSTLATAGRNDAECFHPSAKRVRNFLRQQKSMPVEEVCDFVKHGLQPTYLEAGRVGIVSQRQFSASGLDLASLENFTDEEFCEANPDFRLRRGDVLTYCVSAGEYLGRTFLFDSDIPCVAASFVTILRTKKLVPGYLALFLNSPFGLIQSNALKRGTSPFYLYPRDFKKVLIYVPRTRAGAIDLAWQEKLATKVETSTRAREVAKAKLAEAKQLVEEALSS